MRDKSDGYYSKEYKFLMKLFSEPLDKYSEEQLNKFKDSVTFMQTKDESSEFLQAFTNSRYKVLDKLDKELEMRKKKPSAIILPGSTDDYTLFESALIEKARGVENRVDVDAAEIVARCSKDLPTTMDFIKLADKYLESGSNIDLSELIQWMQSKGIRVVSTHRDFKSSFIKDFKILVSEYLEYQGESERDSDNHAEIILMEAFDQRGFESAIREVYRNTRDGEDGDRLIEIANTLVHYNIFNDSFINFIKNYI